MRLFIAINFSEETRIRLLALRDKLRLCSERGNFSAPENLHMTLAFLGECDARQTAAVKTVMDGIRFEPFSTIIDCIGRFKRDGGDIWWAGVQASNALIDTHRDLTDKLIDTGFTLDRRKYSPHITLGREVITNASTWHIEPFGETIAGIELMKSERINGKLTYTAIYKRNICPF